MKTMTFFSGVTCAILAGACGGRAATDTSDGGLGPTSPGNGTPGNEGGTMAATDACGAVRAPSAPPSDDGGVAFHGVVAAYSDSSGPTIEAGFPLFGFTYAVASGPGTKCSCLSGVALPVGSENAGTITVERPHCGGVLATLLYYGNQAEADYSATSQLPWNPGDTLDVVATGGVTPFSGTLQTGGPIVGLSPATLAGPQPLNVSRSQDFVLTWMPEGKSGESVMVDIRQPSPQSQSCACVAPDSDGKITLGAALLQGFVPTTSPNPQNTQVYVTVSRSIVSSVYTASGRVDLVGQVAVGGTLNLQ
jgi:hypothetical protein